MRTYGHRIFALAALLLGALAAPAPAQTVRVSPAVASVPFGGDRRLTAYVNGLASTAVVWSVEGVAGGNATVGFVDPTGKYTAPASGVSGSQVTVRAASRQNPDSAASCLVTLRNPVPWLTAVTPRTVPMGAFTLQVVGNRFVEGAVVLWNGAALATSFQSATQLTATGTATQSGWMKVSVANPGPNATSGTWSVLVSADRVATRTTTAILPTRTATRAEPTRTATVPLPTRTATRAEPTRTATVPLPTRTATRAEPTRTATQRPEPTRTMEPSITATLRPTATRPEPSRTMPPTATASAERSATMMPSVPSRTEASRTIPPTATARTEVSRTMAPTATVAAGTPSASPTANTPDPLAVSYGRLLDQTTFGPTQALTARVAQLGIAAFIDEQLAMPESPWPALDTTDRGDAIDAFFGNALSGPDQLRQRVIYALSEIIVEAMNKNTNADEIIPWLQLLSRNAFGNYRTLLREITLDASMGKYLDLANSGIMGGAANENFPREVMQLFSLGLYKLNLDGSVQRDAQNVPISTYSETDVKQLAKALTGWTYGNPSGTPPSYGNSNYYPGPMLPVAAYHNKTAKTILGQTLPSNQTAQQDLDGAIDILFQHSNVGPFVAIRLIRALVTSNPSPAYVARVATAFNGAGTRGDMKAVLRAILLDPEARNDTPPANFGRLRTPMQHTIALARALSLDVGPASQFAYLFYDMHEGMLDAASVFGHYSPMYRIPVVGLFGPEFQIYSASSAIDRANFFYWFMYSPWPINPALQPFVAVAGNAAALVNAVDTALLYGRMLPATRNALLTALPAMPDNNARVLTAVYLTAMSGEYLVQR